MQLTFYYNNGYIYYSFYAADERVSKSLGLKISKVDWDNGKLPKAYTNRLNSLKIKVDKFVSNKQIALEHILKSDIEHLIDSEIHLKAKTNRSYKAITLKTVFNDHYERIKSGTILNNGKPYSESTKRIINSMIKSLEKTYLFEKNARDIKADDIEYFNNYLVGQNLSQNTISLYGIYFMSIFKATYKIHGNNVFKEDIEMVSAEKVDYSIALTEQEVLTLYNLKLTNKKEILYRDKFVFGCFIGQRFSDHKELTEISLTGDIFHIRQQKKGKIVDIPLTNKIALEIWNKYKGNIPVGNLFSLNKYIRKIAKEAGLTTMILFTRTQGGKVVKKYVPKWSLISTHTMRRTWATNALRNGVPITYIKAILGHSDIKQTETYLRVTTADIAQDMLKHQYFKKEA